MTGEFGDPEFDYLKISLKGCDLGEDKCAKEEELYDVALNLAHIEEYPDLFKSPSIFKHNELTRKDFHYVQPGV